MITSWLSRSCFAGVLLAVSLVSMPLPSRADAVVPHGKFGSLELELVRSRASAHDTALTRSVKAALAAKDWQQLEILARRADQDQNYSLKGYNDASVLMAALTACGERDCESQLALLREWMVAEPKSSIAPVAFADLMVKYAWDARGSDGASHVSKDAWQKFEQRLAQARQTLDGAAAGGTKKTRSWYYTMQTVALGQGWSKESYQSLFDEATKAYPTHQPFYFQKAYWLLPRWYGQEKEWETFSAMSADKLGGKAGDMLYARIVWSIQQLTDDDEFSVVSMERVRKGFDVMAQTYSKTSDGAISAKSACAKMALAKGDKRLAREMFNDVGNQVSMYVWNYKSTFVKDREAAFVQ
ncbi:MAG: DUF4034 domain-containing protein [Candidatus Obscuribacterales bacterium]|nr:DUF4034 domain-containing protein [Candidatus Obscuribacterales bacterium]